MNSEPPDRISPLPDDVLSKILSFLPTKFAVASTILSTRWKFLFTSVLDIDLSDTLFVSHDMVLKNHEELVKLGCAERFVRFVDKLFIDRSNRNSLNIPKFRLHCVVKHDQSIVNAWICRVLSCNVRKLDLWLQVEENNTVPDEIFTCKTLEFLKLGHYFNLNVPESIFLHNLKELMLDFLTLAGDNFFGRVLSGCPVLEDLRIFSCELIDMDVFEISHPRLRNLLLSYCVDEYYFVLDTPNLENLMYSTRGDTGFLMKNTKSLVHADINWGTKKDMIVETEDDEDVWWYSNLGTKIINQMHNVKSIYLSDVSLSALYFSDVALATFQNLTLMELGVSYICGWQLLPELLASSPNLEVLVFYEGLLDKDDPEKEVKYCLPESVPVCFSRCLREIKIGEFNEQECEFKLVEYFLKSAQVLRKMVIGAEVSSKSPFGFKRWGKGRTLLGIDVPPNWLLPTFKRLSAAPKCSKTCEIVLSWKEWTELCRISLTNEIQIEQCN